MSATASRLSLPDLFARLLVFGAAVFLAAVTGVACNTGALFPTDRVGPEGGDTPFSRAFGLCVTRADCTSPEVDLDCVAGFCAEPCTVDCGTSRVCYAVSQDAAIGALDRGSQTIGGAADHPGICLPTCESDCGEDFECVEGLCGALLETDPPDQSDTGLEDVPVDQDDAGLEDARLDAGPDASPEFAPFDNGVALLTPNSLTFYDASLEAGATPVFARELSTLTAVDYASLPGLHAVVGVDSGGSSRSIAIAITIDAVDGVSTGEPIGLEGCEDVVSAVLGQDGELIVACLGPDGPHYQAHPPEVSGWSAAPDGDWPAGSPTRLFRVMGDRVVALENDRVRWLSGGEGVSDSDPEGLGADLVSLTTSSLHTYRPSTSEVVVLDELLAVSAVWAPLPTTPVSLVADTSRERLLIGLEGGSVQLWSGAGEAGATTEIGAELDVVTYEPAADRYWVAGTDGLIRIVDAESLEVAAERIPAAGLIRIVPFTP